MKLLLSKYSGYCPGVKRAVGLAVDAAKLEGRAYSLGKLVHNAAAIADLEQEGVFSVSSPEEIPLGSVAIIRSHGAPKSDYQALAARKARIVDATCPSVAAIHKKAEEYSAEGWYVLIIGNPAHPEVLGTLGWCARGKACRPSQEIEIPPEEDKILVVAQTTLNPDLYNETCKKIYSNAKISCKSVEFFNSICYTTIVREKSAESIAKASDAVLVIGDSSSSNTNTLLAVAGRYCPQTFLISDAAGLASEVNKLKSITILGVVASASAPQRLIMEVINRMDQENTVDTVVIDEVKDTQSTEEAPQAAPEAPAAAPEQSVAAPEAPIVAPEASEAAVAAPEAPVLAPEAPVLTPEAPVLTPEAPKAEPRKFKADEPMTMERAMRHYVVKSYREGMRVKARIISADASGISVAVEGLGKNDSGFIDKEEVELDGNYDPSKYAPDMHIDAVIIAKSADSKTKGINLSLKQYEIVKLEDEAVKKIIEGEEFSLVCNQSIKGGLLGHIGTYTVFVPASQIRIGYVKNLEDYVGKKLRLRVLPPKESEAAIAEEDDGESKDEKRRSNPKRIVAGQRALLEEEKFAREEAFWEVMQVNNIIKGKVKRFTAFGAFVSIMNFDCLAHISDLSWTKINDPSEVLEINKSYDFVVIKVDRENGKVSLGYKQLQKKPYELAAEKYSVGDVIKGKVERIKDFGAFIEIEPGIDGLVHVSEIGYKWIANANEALKIGEEVDAKIIGFENNKITLSIKQLLPPPEVMPVEETSSSSYSSSSSASSESSAERPSRSSRFAKRAEGAADTGKDRRDRRPRFDKEDNGEPREWVTPSNGGATFADLFKDFDLNNFESKDE